jgi:hypothetical protein
MKILQRFGCEKIGFMDDFAKQELLLVFEHRGRQVRFPASAKGWAQMWLKENPWSSRTRRSRHEYEQDALKRGRVAVNSIVRDWVKSQITAVECGIFSFGTVFMPFTLTNDGRTVSEWVEEAGMLPEPTPPKVVLLPGR